MKLVALKWPTKTEESQYMRMRQRQNRKKGMTPAEAWAFKILSTQTKYKWTFQVQWGYRLFDFWCHDLGCAVEIDGKEHNKGKDRIKDNWHWFRSRIVVLRIPNFNQSRMDEVIAQIKILDKWSERRKDLNHKALKHTVKRLRYEQNSGQSVFDI